MRRTVRPLPGRLPPTDVARSRIDGCQGIAGVLAHARQSQGEADGVEETTRSLRAQRRWDSAVRRLDDRSHRARIRLHPAHRQSDGRRGGARCPAVHRASGRRSTHAGSLRRGHACRVPAARGGVRTRPLHRGGRRPAAALRHRSARHLRRCASDRRRGSPRREALVGALVLCPRGRRGCSGEHRDRHRLGGCAVHSRGSVGCRGHPTSCGQPGVLPPRRRTLRRGGRRGREPARRAPVRVLTATGGHPAHRVRPRRRRPRRRTGG